MIQVGRWTEMRVGDCCVVGDGAHASIARQSDGVMYLTSKNFKPSGLDLSKIDYISEQDFQRHFRETSKAITKPSSGDVLVSIIGTLGEPYVVKPTDRFGLSSSVAILRPRIDVVVPEYLYYWMRGHTFQSSVYGIKGGVAQSYLSLEMIRSLPVRVPSVAVQHSIVEILSVYDSLVENNTRRIKIVEQMAQLIYREWFVNFRFPGHEKVRLGESALGQIPQGWSWVELGEMCERITDGSHWSPETVENGLPMASVKDMDNWGLNLSTCRKIAERDFQTLVRNDCKPLVNDILIAKDGSYLKHCSWVQKPIRAVILSSIAMLRPKDRITPLYLLLHLQDPQIKSRMKGYVSGVAIPRIVLKDFRRFQILFPPKELQHLFSEVVEPMLRLCLFLTEVNAKLRDTRDLLLPKLVSGEVSVGQIETEALAQTV